MLAADILLPVLGVISPEKQLARGNDNDHKKFDDLESTPRDSTESAPASKNPNRCYYLDGRSCLPTWVTLCAFMQCRSWHRVLLLVVAITVHNFPEGMAVGVGFGGIGRSAGASFGNARSLAIGIGLQNFPGTMC